MSLFRYALVLGSMVSVLRANPVAIETPYTMIGEHVLVGITARGAVVSGRYRFHVTPDAAELWGHPPYPVRLRLPVPVPTSLQRDAIAAEVRPFITIKGARYEPDRDVEFWRVPSIPRDARVAGFYFWIDRQDLGDEFEVEIQYDQPIITAGGRDMVYYVPFLPTFEQYSRQMRLRRESFTIDCEGADGTYIRLLSPSIDVVRSEPRSVSVYPRNLEVIAIERLPNQSPDRTAPRVTPPASASEDLRRDKAQEPRH